METDNNNYNLSNTINSQGEVSQATTSESVSNSLPPPDLSHLIKHFKKLKKDIEKEFTNMNNPFSPQNYYYIQGKSDLIDDTLKYISSLGIVD